MDREAWHAAVHRFVKSRTRLSDWVELIEEEIVQDFMQWHHLDGIPKFGVCSSYLQIYQINLVNLLCADQDLRDRLHITKLRRYRCTNYIQINPLLEKCPWTRMITLFIVHTATLLRLKKKGRRELSTIKLGQEVQTDHLEQSRTYGHFTYNTNTHLHGPVHLLPCIKVSVKSK